MNPNFDYGNYIMDSFEFESGRVLENVNVEYETRGVPEYDENGETIVSSPIGVFIEGQTDKVTIIKGNRVYAVADVGIHCSDKIDLLDNPNNSN